MAPSAAAILCAAAAFSLSAPWHIFPSLVLARAEDADAEDTAVDEDASGDDASNAANVDKFSNSAKEVQDKLGQLRALLDQRGDSADPKLKEQLEQLEAQLKGLDLSSLANPAGSDEGVTKLMGACAMLSVKRAGAQRPSTMAGLRRLSDSSLSKQDAADSEISRMIVACVNELTGDQLDQYTGGALQMLPKEIANKASTPEARDYLTQLDDTLWGHLQVTAKTLYEQLREQRGGGEDLATSNYIGLLALLPMVAIALFIGKKFYDMQQMQGAKKDKSSKKKKGS
jgi:hypothetical protein